MKSVFRINGYYEKDMMVITSLPQHYRDDDSHETVVSFFTNFDFKDMSKNI